MIPWWRYPLCWLGWHCESCTHRMKRECCACGKQLWWAIVATILLMPMSASAKPFYRDWKWWVGYGAIIGANALDLASTARVQYVCSGCQEENLFSTGKPHYARMALINAGLEGGIHFSLSHFARRRLGGRWVTLSDFEWPVASWAMHGSAAVQNYNLAGRVYANHVAQDIPLPGGQTPWRVR